MPPVRFEASIPIFELTKKFRDFDRMASMIGPIKSVFKKSLTKIADRIVEVYLYFSVT